MRGQELESGESIMVSNILRVTLSASKPHPDKEIADEHPESHVRASPSAASCRC